MADNQSVYNIEQIRKLEKLYARFHDGSTYALMERAGKAAFDLLRRRWPLAQRLLVICGKGNNGGDGFIVARLAQQAGLNVQVVMLKPEFLPKGDAGRAFELLKQTSVEVVSWSEALLEGHDLIIDAMLGIGIQSDVREPYTQVIHALNQCALPVLALDIPSGLDADTGMICGVCIEASVTLTFIGQKRGLLTGQAADVCGDIELDELECGQGVFSLVSTKVSHYRYEQGIRWLKPRPPVCHKGMFGHVLIVGGAPGMAGAARMAAEAAGRTGAGLVSVLTHQSHAALVSVQRPEIMSHGVGEDIDISRLVPLLKKASVIAMGPGLGLDSWGRQLAAAVDEFVVSNKVPCVYDADALTWLSENPASENPVNQPLRVITPHPGEAARLLECANADIQRDRFSAVERLNEVYGGVCVLKGAGSLIASNGKTSVATYGNPGMASGGMGDVLTGIIAGLMAQGIPAYDASQLGVAIHGLAADDACEQKTEKAHHRGLLATDLMPYIRTLVNPAP
ncbi:NAD(P)H-hydrate dehydratase [Pleionea sp. CnH1-48]|uniref:NAD(P)H-hydrate dehydratase n=1 Tax=Pleionea sp. CnH1-48 TaxID=2954494 RepID=UPI00209739F4|nr:NAD(P)H-hydrate dehydratase [Pleionea sp. CnH1-48]MCO7224869.1 NAD(P)H-hydrate dehydratase [Pleionea sp. CnH1-48]